MAPEKKMETEPLRSLNFAKVTKKSRKTVIRSMPDALMDVYDRLEPFFQVPSPFFSIFFSGATQ